MNKYNSEINRIFGTSNIHKLAEENRKRTNENLKRFSKELGDSLNHLHESAKPTVSGYESIVADIKAGREYQRMLKTGKRFTIEHSIGDGMMITVHEDGSYEIMPKPIPCNW